MTDIRQAGISEATEIEEEFNSALTAAVLVDRSSVGKLQVTGADALDLLHRLSTNDLSGLKPFTTIGTVFTTDKGRVVDFVRVLSLSDSLLLITSPSKEERLKEWIDKYTIMEDLKVANVTANFAMYSIIGPQARATGEQLFKHPFLRDEVMEFQFADAEVFVALENVFATSCLNIIAPREEAGGVWDRLKDETKALGINVMGESGYEVFRVFQGIPREGFEITDAFNPYEVGLSPWISLTKGCYIGQEVIARLDTYDKVQRKLVRVSFAESVPSESGKLRLTKEGDEVGVLTSFAVVPVKGEYFGLGVVRKNSVSTGSTLIAPFNRTELKATVTETFNHDSR